MSKLSKLVELLQSFMGVICVFLLLIGIGYFCVYYPLLGTVIIFLLLVINEIYE